MCDSWEWRGWAGYLAASSYSLVPEMEYYAIRHSAGLLDVSPLYKYLITGKDALHLVNKVVTRDASKLAKGQIYYTPWCDERGKTVDDGTLWNFGDGSFRMTSAEPNLKWLQDAGMGLDVEVQDVSEDIGALALQGPSSRAIVLEGADGAVQKLKYFRFVKTEFDGIPVHISRTGYTGDLGYEIWVERERAEALWDAVMEKGRGHDITAAGMLALDIARIEAGLILAEVEYMPSRKAIIEAQMYSPLELSLDWTVAGGKGGRGETVLRTAEKEGLRHATIPLSSPRLRSAPWRRWTRSSSGAVTTGSSPPRTSRRRASRSWSWNAAPSWAAHASRRKFIPGSAPRHSRTHAASCGLKSRPTSISHRSAWRSTSTIPPSSSPSRTVGSCSIGTKRIGIGSRWRSSRRRTPRPGPGTHVFGTSSRNWSSRPCLRRPCRSRTSHRSSAPRRRKTSFDGSSSRPSRTCFTNSSSPTR